MLRASPLGGASRVDRWIDENPKDGFGQLGLLAKSEIATDELPLPKEATDLGYWARSQGVLGHLSAG
jgi:hypothetical protein